MSKTDQVALNDTLQRTIAPDSILTKLEYIVNDTLDQIAQVIGGSIALSPLFPIITSSKEYEVYREKFNKRWLSFDTTRIRLVSSFQMAEIANKVSFQPNLFYPFSGPDYLYASLFFPTANEYLLIGLEPIGSLTFFEKTRKDSITSYFNALNNSLNAILQFSFFRTNSMEDDLSNSQIDGVIHLLFLFLNRTGNKIISAKPIGIDSLGNKFDYISFNQLKKTNNGMSGIEIKFLSLDQKVKKLNYYSINASNEGLRKNKGFVTYLHRVKQFNTYLKGASYLLHKPNFSVLRNFILNSSSSVVQDDSGIAFHFFEENSLPWNYTLYGTYSKPISLFSKHFQPDLDSVYQLGKVKKLGFGIGYNFKDKNSNLMVATHL